MKNILTYEFGLIKKVKLVVGVSSSYPEVTYFVKKTVDDQTSNYYFKKCKDVFEYVKRVQNEYKKNR
tara:strand:- start:10 stop:210 length:201 start_codon:yes stop_codon:yes gene_type:complete